MAVVREQCILGRRGPSVGLRDRLVGAKSRASRGDVAPHVTASGSSNPVVTVQVGTYVSGVLKELACDFNTRVRKGQLCARIDPLPCQTIVDQAQANLSAAQAPLNKDQVNLEYAKLANERWFRAKSPRFVGSIERIVSLHAMFNVHSAGAHPEEGF